MGSCTAMAIAGSRAEIVPMQREPIGEEVSWKCLHLDK